MSSEPSHPHDRYSTRTQRLRSAWAGKRRVLPSDPGPVIRQAVLDDPYLRQAYSEMYRTLAGLIPSGAEPIVEIGAGSGIGKTWIPGMLCTDVVTSPDLDGVVDATRMPFGESTIGAFVLKDAFHHIPDVSEFLDECVRCLKPGGVAVICDPYWGPLAGLIYRFLHPERFDRRQREWRFEQADEWDSNQALLWIVLQRDRDRLATRWPELAFEPIGPILGPSYALSGGVFGRTPVPSSWLSRLWRHEVRMGSSLNPLRLEYVVRIVKKSTSSG